MRGRPDVLRHGAFLAALTEEGDPVGPADVYAGLAVLRLVENAVRSDFETAEPDAIAAQTARAAVAALPATHVEAALLLRIVNAIADGGRAGMAPALPMVMAYAKLLEAHGKDALVVDVCGTVVVSSAEVDEPEIHQLAWLTAARAQLRLARHDAADHAFTTAHAIATWRDDREAQIRALTGRANVARSRGNLPLADRLLGGVIQRALRERRPALAAVALQDRAVVAHRRGDIKRAISLAYRAYTTTDQPGTRERILGDLGGFFIIAGRWAAARDALTLQERTATTDEIRRAAQGNLLALAARSGDVDLFAEYCARLDGVPLPPDFEVNVQIETARGVAWFGQRALGAEMARAAARFAERHQLARAVFEAEDLARELDAAPARRSTVATAVSPPVATVERALRQLATAAAL